MEKVFSVEEAQTKLYAALADAMDFKYLKSQRCLKKTVKNLIFEVDFYSSKWNRSGESVNIEAGFVIMFLQQNIYLRNYLMNIMYILISLRKFWELTG